MSKLAQRSGRLDSNQRRLVSKTSVLEQTRPLPDKYVVLNTKRPER